MVGYGEDAGVFTLSPINPIAYVNRTQFCIHLEIRSYRRNSTCGARQEDAREVLFRSVRGLRETAQRLRVAGPDFLQRRFRPTSGVTTDQNLDLAFAYHSVAS
jgi:hypothetical protein